LNTPDNPAGVDGSVFEGIQASIAKDRFAYLTAFFSDFYNLDVLLGTRISEEVVRDSWNIAAGASAKATYDCPPTWATDFRKDLSRIDVPTLVMHGDADRILPITATGLLTHAAVKGSHLVVVEGAPHGMLWTHAEEVSRTLVDFLS
jgi:pimeloyl-ACP methyl ester carboxylesterase